MSDRDVSDIDDRASDASRGASLRDTDHVFRSWVSDIDLLNHHTLLCDAILGDRKEDGAPVRTPHGELIPDSPTGFLMSPPSAPNLEKVAEAGRALGKLVWAISKSAPPPVGGLAAFGTLAVGLGINLGFAGRFDYQREGTFFGGYVQHTQFRAISDVNVGVFGQQAGLTKGELLFIAGLFARAGSSNATWQYPFLHPKTKSYIEQGYELGASGVFNTPHVP